MKKTILFLFLAFQYFSTAAQEDLNLDSKLFSLVPRLQIRALEVLSESKVWFAANRGVWGYTEDAGANWHIDSIKVDSVYPEFRAIATLNDSTFLLLSTKSPAYLFKTTNKGKTWRLVYKNTNEKIFFDCMKFYTKTSGIAVADPIDGSFPIIKTEDGGEPLDQMPPENIPGAEPEEGIYAACNTNIVIRSKNIWFLTGGLRSRIFYSNDLGKHFKSFDQPFPQIEQMTKNGTMDFLDSKIGVIGGGNGDKADTTITKLAITKDGGNTWESIKPNLPFAVSCVQFRSKDEFYFTSRDGTFKCEMKNRTFSEIKDAKGASLKFYTLRITPSGKGMWLAGAGGKIVFVNLDARKPN